MKTDDTRTIRSLIAERAVFAFFVTAVLAFFWLAASGWVLRPAMLLVPVFVIAADTLFFWLIDRKREGLWLFASIALAALSAFCFFSLVIWLLPVGFGLDAVAMIAGGYFAVRLGAMLVA